MSDTEHQNRVEFIGSYGGDLVHALSAWTSTGRDLPEEKLARVDGMLAMLSREGHHTPFEKSMLHFLVRTDVATHIQLLKHRIAVPINAESARYKELKEDNFYLPPDWPDVWRRRLAGHTEQGNLLYHACLDDLTKTHGMSRKRAKESARYFKGYNSQIEADVAFNFRSFAHLQYLRNDGHAQDEIAVVAQSMLAIVRELPQFAGTLTAFEQAGIIPCADGVRLDPPPLRAVKDELAKVTAERDELRARLDDYLQDPLYNPK